MLRSVAAVIAGYVVMMVIVMAGTMALMAAFVPGGMQAMRNRETIESLPPSTRYLASNIVLSLMAAIAGGWATAKVATASPTGPLIALASVMIAMGIISALAPGAKRQPGWYKVLIPLVGAGGVGLIAVWARP